MFQESLEWFCFFFRVEGRGIGSGHSLTEYLGRCYCPLCLLIKTFNFNYYEERNRSAESKRMLDALRLALDLRSRRNRLKSNFQLRPPASWCN